VTNTELADEREHEDDLRDLLRSRLRWGAVSLPPEYSELIHLEPGETVMHLTFGAEEVSEPEVGKLYI
jgi:hypothetical protein